MNPSTRRRPHMPWASGDAPVVPGVVDVRASGRRRSNEIIADADGIRQVLRMLNERLDLLVLAGGPLSRADEHRDDHKQQHVVHHPCAERALVWPSNRAASCQPTPTPLQSSWKCSKVVDQFSGSVAWCLPVPP